MADLLQPGDWAALIDHCPQHCPCVLVHAVTETEARVRFVWPDSEEWGPVTLEHTQEMAAAHDANHEGRLLPQYGSILHRYRLEQLIKIEGRRDAWPAQPYTISEETLENDMNMEEMHEHNDRREHWPDPHKYSTDILRATAITMARQADCADILAVLLSYYGYGIVHGALEMATMGETRGGAVTVVSKLMQPVLEPEDWSPEVTSTASELIKAFSDDWTDASEEPEQDDWWELVNDIEKALMTSTAALKGKLDKVRAALEIDDCTAMTDAIEGALK